MKKRSGIVAVGSVLALLLAGCSGGSESPETSDGQGEDFVVVYVSGLSGPLAGITSGEVAALQVAADQINEDGGIQGRNVVVETLDSKGDPTEAVTVLQERLNQSPKPDLLKIGLSSAETLAMAPLAMRAGIASYSSAASPDLADQETYPLLRLLSSPFSRQNEMIRLYAESEEVEKLAVLAPQSASGDGTVQSISAAFEDSKVELAIHRYNPESLDLTVDYQRALDDDPDLIFADCIGEPCSRLLSALETVAGGLDVPAIGGTSLSGTGGGPADYASPEALDALNLLLFAGQVALDEADQTESFKRFFPAYLAKDPSGFVGGSITYDGLMMYAAAAEEAGSTDAEDLVAAVDSIEWAPGFFTSYGQAALDWNGESNFPFVPADGFAVVGAGPMEDLQYQPKNLVLLSD